jgi:hypothetical protein
MTQTIKVNFDHTNTFTGVVVRIDLTIKPDGTWFFDLANWNAKSMAKPIFCTVKGQKFVLKTDKTWSLN